MNDKTLNMRIPDVLYKDVQDLAAKKNISMASLVRLVLTEYVENNK